MVEASDSDLRSSIHSNYVDHLVLGLSPYIRLHVAWYESLNNHIRDEKTNVSSLAMLLAMLGNWAAVGKPKYESMEKGQDIAYV